MFINKHVRRLDAIQSRTRRDPLPAANPAADGPVESVTCLQAACEPALKRSLKSHTAAAKTPALYDIGTRDHRAVMDVAVFRLGKKHHRANTVILYEFPDGYVQVSSGPHGMASIWDYDIVLLAISYLNEGMNQHREGKAPKPEQTVVLPVQAVLKFCGKDNGGHQKNGIAGALERLGTTYIIIQRTRNTGAKPEIITEGESLINKFKVITDGCTKKVKRVEIKVADWMYQEITERPQPDVLAVNPDYFHIKQGVGRFVYRLARQSAGKGSAFWNFGTLFMRSGSTGSRGEFNRLLREVIKANSLPDYFLTEEQSKTDAALRMVYRSHADRPKA